VTCEWRHGINLIRICYHTVNRFKENSKMCWWNSYFIHYSYHVQVSAADDRLAQRSASRPPRCTQTQTVSVIKLLVTDDRHQFITLSVHLSWQHLRRSTWPLSRQLFHRYGWYPPKFKWFTWPNHASLWMVCHPRASTLRRLTPTRQIWSLYLHSLRRYERRYQMWKMGWFE